MGEQLDANFDLTAMSLNNVPVQNYADTFAKLDPTVFANLNLAGINTAADGTLTYFTSSGAGARLSNASMPAITCNPCFAFVAGTPALATVNVPFNLTRVESDPLTALAIGIAPVDSDGAPVDAIGTRGSATCANTLAADCYDLDADATAGNDHVLIGTTEFRYGRLRLANAYGSERLPLGIRVSGEYFLRGAWLPNTLDSITSLTSIAQSGLAVTVTPASGNLTAGVLDLTVNSSSAAGNVSLTPVVDTASCPVPASCYLPITSGRATFGVYSGGNRFIYRRERY